MIKILTSSGDTYVTNKIVDGSFSVSGNVGRAGTLDLFKLYDESVPTGSNEISRILVNFDVSQLRNMSSSIDIGSPTFKANLKLKSLSLGQPVPSKFTVSVFPLSSSFTEGVGRDVVSFADVGSANWLSSSDGILWSAAGCGLGADLSTSSDYITSDTSFGVSTFEKTQYFDLGNEDLDVDVTSIISSSLAGRLNFKGFRISFSGSNETDAVTRFVKRFGSTNARDFYVRPKLVVQCDDSIVDNRSSSFVDSDNRLYFFSSERGYTSPFKELNGSQVTGSNCIVLTLTTSSFSASFTGSQVSTTSGTRVPGAYFVSFYVSGTATISGTQKVSDFLSASGSIKFNESLKTQVGGRSLRTGTLTLKASSWNVTSQGDPDFIVSLHSTNVTFSPGESTRIIARFFDRNEESRASKFPIQVSQTEVYGARYRLRDSLTGDLLFDFCEGSRMSLDSGGWFADIPTEGMKVGSQYGVEFSFVRNGKTYNVVDRSTRLRVN